MEFANQFEEVLWSTIDLAGFITYVELVQVWKAFEYPMEELPTLLNAALDSGKIKRMREGEFFYHID